MNTQELRIGNYVNLINRWNEKELLIIKGISFRGNVYDIDDNIYGLDNYEPIPLTEEWLLRFGFDIDINPIVSEKVYVKYLRDKRTQSIEIGIDMEFYNGIYSQKISHVNQLQNLYFALTGEELTP